MYHPDADKYAVSRIEYYDDLYLRNSIAYQKNIEIDTIEYNVKDQERLLRLSIKLGLEKATQYLMNNSLTEL